MMPLDPSKFSLQKAWSVLREARRNRNGLSAAIYDSWAKSNAMPTLDAGACDTLATYGDFVKHHNSIWLMN
jgi:hypothetical protein